ncbi:MAG: cytochrome C oxidase subunit IV family protein [Candidatus Krumholzibacteriia bacterium]
MSVHRVPIRVYFAVFVGLLACTGFTVYVAFQNMGVLNDVLALTIAVTKATLVVLFFMHVRYSTRLTKLVVTSALVWLLILVGFTLSDYISRGWLDIPGK